MESMKPDEHQQIDSVNLELRELLRTSFDLHNVYKLIITKYIENVSGQKSVGQLVSSCRVLKTGHSVQFRNLSNL